MVEYVNNGWKTDYKVEDVVGMEINSTFIFVHFNKEDYTKDAYPIAVEMKRKSLREIVVIFLFFIWNSQEFCYIKTI